MSALYPKAGGVYVFYNRRSGRSSGSVRLVVLLVVLGGGCAAVAVGFADYRATSFRPSRTRAIAHVPLGSERGRSRYRSARRGRIAALLGGINYLGVRSGARRRDSDDGEIAGLVLCTIFAWRREGDADFTHVVPPGLTSPLVAFGIALVPVLWANDGFYFRHAAGEVRDPTRNLRALTISLPAVLVSIWRSISRTLYALPIDQIAGTTRVAESGDGARRASRRHDGRAHRRHLDARVQRRRHPRGIAIALSIAADSCSSKLRREFTRSSPVRTSPSRASRCGRLLALWALPSSCSCVVFTSVLFSLRAGLALFRLRMIHPHAVRPYRVWGYPIVPAFFTLGSVFVVLNMLFTRPIESLVGLGFLVIGLPAYSYWKAK
jgi:APA family basic amino acid/polyamine antiporter